MMTCTSSVKQFGYAEALADHVVAARSKVSANHPWID
jgi:hypothetical protein